VSPRQAYEETKRLRQALEDRGDATHSPALAILWELERALFWVRKWR
jgi:hypothetical protein